jgi:hypothetical protein
MFGSGPSNVGQPRRPTEAVVDLDRAVSAQAFVLAYAYTGVRLATRPDDGSGTGFERWRAGLAEWRHDLGSAGGTRV